VQPPADSRAPLVWARSMVLGVAALLAGVVPHVAAGGRLPGVGALAALLALAVVVGSRLLGTWAGPWRLVAFVVVAQGAVHAVLSVLAGHRGDTATTGAALTPAPRLESLTRVGSLQDVYESGLAQAPASPSQDVLAHQWAHLVDQGPWMVMAHALGAVALGLFLARGEQALSGLVGVAVLGAAAWLVDRVRTLEPIPVSVPSAAPAARAVLARASQLLDRSSHPLRGPPLLLVA